MRRLTPLAITLVLVAGFATTHAAMAKTTTHTAAKAKKKRKAKPVNPNFRKAIWGPTTINGKSAFPTYKDLGVGIYEYPLPWWAVAKTKPADPTNPADPAYKWPASLDFAISEAQKYGMRVLVRVSGSPKWANGGKAPAYTPNDANDLATFMATASKRYPYVTYWDVWEETTRNGSFLPLVPETRGQPLNAAQADAPHRYAVMLDAAYGALKAVDPKDVVVGGNSFVSGDISPKNFIANLRLPDGRPPRMDMYAHNPFSGRRPKLSKPPLPSGFADMSDLDTLAGWIDQNLQRGTHKIPIFVTEFTLPTDHPNYLFNFYVSRQTQSDWTTAALQLARNYPRVAALGWWTALDDKPNKRGDEGAFGLLDYQGNPKPAYLAFKRG